MMQASPDVIALQSKNQALRKKYKVERVKSAMLSLKLMFEKQKTQLEADMGHLKVQLEEKLTSIQQSNDAFFAEILAFFAEILEEVTHMANGTSCDGLAAQLHTASIGDTGSSSELYEALALARLAEVDGDQGKFADACVISAEPLAPDPQFINHPELFQQQLHSVVPQLHLLDKSVAFVDEEVPGHAPPGLSLPDEHGIGRITLHKDPPKLGELEQQPFTDASATSAVTADFWDTDDKLLLQMEERQAAESGADQHNMETFGEIPSLSDNQSRCSERTDYTHLVCDDVCKVETQLKVQKMLSMHFDMPFHTLSDGVAHLKKCAGTPEYYDFEKKITSRFGDVNMLPLFEKINRQANIAKHPRKPATTEQCLSDECGDSSAEELADTIIWERRVATALGKHVIAMGGCKMPASQISGFYKQRPHYKDVITKNGRKCREFCEAHPSLLQFDPAGSGSIQVPLTWPHEESVSDVLGKSPDIAKHLCVVISDLNEGEQAMSPQEFQSLIEQQTGDNLPACPQKMKHVAKIGCPDLDSVSRVRQCFAGRAEEYEVRWPKKLRMHDVLKKPSFAERLVALFHQIDGKQLAHLAKDISEAAGVTLAVDPFIPSTNENIAFVGCRTEADRRLVLSTFPGQAKPYRKK